MFLLYHNLCFLSIFTQAHFYVFIYFIYSTSVMWYNFIMLFRINNAFYRQLPQQIGIFFLPKFIKSRIQKRDTSKLVEDFEKIQPEFSKKELEKYQKSFSKVKFWHGTGGFEYGKNSDTVAIFEKILHEGLKTHQDDHLVIYSPKLSTRSVSLVENRTIARCYADIHNFKKPKIRFGDSIFWIVRHYVKMYILAYTIHSPRSLLNIARWRKLNNINKSASWSNKINKSARNTWESFETHSDVEGNFPVILGISKLEKIAKIPKIFSHTETRSLENIPRENIIHVEIPQNLLEELSPKIREFLPNAEIFSIELGEKFLFESHKK